MTQPTALYIADILEDAGKPADIAEKAASELRRLHAKCEALTADTIEEMRRINEIYELTVQRDALLEALKALIDMDVAYRRGPVVEKAVEVARAAIAKTEGEQ